MIYDLSKFEELIKEGYLNKSVKDAKHELQIENDDLKKHISMLQAEIKSLKPFETYYEMTFKMEHGK
jgi:hypothetical protein